MIIENVKNISFDMCIEMFDIYIKTLDVFIKSFDVYIDNLKKLLY